ncbi:MAG TPA: isoprenylcysteine carboxylmethyltransferase family protein [Stellaceae bacterium]|nr:isoprenylcysteine carboxylmethyltransferase family protein [Stellaceae bacterium]
MTQLAEVSRHLIPVFWAIWLAGWLIAAIGVKRTQWRESRATAIYNRAPVLLAVVMLVRPQWLPAALTYRFVPGGPELPAFGTIFVLGGLLFAAWARVHLGGNWSGAVTVKQGHTLITSGPYRWVRHPIYTGMLLALVGTALAIGAAYGFVATALILIGFILKLQVEEARMRDTFPADYDNYSRHTARLIPGVF